MSERKPCPSVEINSKNCGCTYVPCDKKGKRCECIRAHLERNELPGCVFPPEIEKTYDRSIKEFVSTYAVKLECAKLKIQNVGRKIVVGG